MRDEAHPDRSTATSVPKKIRDIVQDLKLFVSDLERRATERGLEKTRGIDQEEKYRWLVEYQIKERFKYQVWKTLATDLKEQAVANGISVATDLIGLRLRSASSQDYPT